jgi:hypothetical protein
MKYIILSILLVVFFISNAQPTGNEHFYINLIEISGSDTTSIDKKWNIRKSRIKNLRIKNYTINDLINYSGGFHRYSIDKYYCQSIKGRIQKFQIVKNKRDTMNVNIHGARGSVFLNIQFQKGDFGINLQNENYSLLPKKIVRTNGALASDITPSNWLKHKIVVENVRVENKTIHINPLDSVSIKKKDFINFKKESTETVSKLLIKSFGDYKAEIAYNPSTVALGSNNGNYVKRLRIYYILNNNLVHEQLIFGDSLKENPFQRDSIEFLNINFDTILDIRFSHYNSTYTYILSHKDDENSMVFYKENILYKTQKYTRDAEKKLITYSEIDENFEITYKLFGLYLDTLVRFIQSIQKPVYAQEYTFINGFGGGLSQIKNKNPNPTEPIAKKEYNDYNMDGFIDYRVQELVSPHNNWNYYLWNIKSNNYLKDTLMSSLNSYYDAETKIFQGSKHQKLGENANQYDTYEFRNKILVVVRRSVCIHDSNQSESSVCSIYEWQNGSLVLIESFSTE